MDLHVTGTNLVITDQVRGYVERKIGKLNKHWSNILETRVELSEENTKLPDSRFLIRVTIDANGTAFHAEERAAEQLKAIDKVTEVLISQLEHRKGKAHAAKGRVISSKQGRAAAAVASPGPARKVVKVKDFLIKPMGIQDAIDEMEVLGHDFFLFLDADTEDLKLVYRRKDGNYGLIEPRTK